MVQLLAGLLVLLCRLCTMDSFHRLTAKSLAASRCASSLYMANEPLVQNNLLSYMEKRSRPAHVGIPRKRMSLQFAVHLMRSSYNTVDDMDFTPMDEFQKSFFLFRQSEWEDYRNYHPNVFQGDLADALYFDFISFCQYAVIADKMKKPKQDFIERVGAAGEQVAVRRNPEFVIDELLPTYHSSVVGDKVLNYMLETFPTITPKDIPRTNSTKIERISPALFLDYSQQIMDTFTIDGYMLEAKLQLVPSNSKGNLMKIVLKAPANLWSLQVLKYRGDQPRNDFEIKVLDALARRCNLSMELISTELVNQIDILHIVKFV